MSATPGNLLRATLALPAFGKASRLHVGDLQLVLERARGGLSLFTHDGVEARTHLLGVPAAGELEVAVCAPQHRVRVSVRDSITLAANGRLRGYVVVPLPRRVVWRRDDGREDTLLELLPADLRTVWLGEGTLGGYAHRAASPFLRAVNGAAPAHSALVPVTLVNRAVQALRPALLSLQLRDRDLRELRGHVVGAARRLTFRDEQTSEETVRPWPAKRGNA